MTTHHFNNGTSLNVSLEQNIFVNSPENFIILESCAGSGKTRCLILKIKQLIEQNKIKADDLIICTYTKAMANVLKYKLKYHFSNSDTNDVLKNAQIGTFHSICYKLIKPLMFDINSEQNVIQQNSQLIDLEYNTEIASHEEILVYTYEHLLSNNINLNGKYFIIDEYQDCSLMQQKILNYLLEKGKVKGMFLIGDKNQTIYSFYNGQSFDSWSKYLLNIDIPIYAQIEYSNQQQSNQQQIKQNKINQLKKIGFLTETNKDNLTTFIEKEEEDELFILGSTKLNTTNLNTTKLKKRIINKLTEPIIFVKFIKYCLTTNYRSTNEIINLANHFKSQNDVMMSIYTYAKYIPKLFIFDKWSEEIDYLCFVLANYCQKNRFKKLGSICVISRYNKTLELIEDKLVGKYNISCNYIKYNNKILYNTINLCTIHSAKGLEFDNVYFVNSSYAIGNNDDEIAEEKRLFYVAITRAKKQFVLSCNKEINKLMLVDLPNIINQNLIEIIDNRKKQTTQLNLVAQLNNTIISDTIISDKTKSWFGVTDLIKLLSGEHIINIKKILSPILNFKPKIKKVHKGLFDSSTIKKIPQIFNDIKMISNTQNVFGLFIDALIMRHIQYLKQSGISYQDLNKLVLLYYLNDKTDITQLNLRQIELLKNLYNMNDAIFKSNILLDKTTYNIPKISSMFEKKLRSAYLKFTDQNIDSLEILYEIFIVSLTNPIINERMSYQYLPNYISATDINNTEMLKEWYQNVLLYIKSLHFESPDIETQTELTNHYLKIIGYADIIIPSKKCIIDVKTSSYQWPKLEYLLQIIIYGLLYNGHIDCYQIYNPIYGIVYEWIYKDDKINKIYITDIKQKLIDYISSILPELKKRSYCDKN